MTISLLQLPTKVPQPGDLRTEIYHFTVVINILLTFS